MICKANSPKDYVWDDKGAFFYCEEHDTIHRMCCNVVPKTGLLCGRIVDHEGKHKSVGTNLEW